MPYMPNMLMISQRFADHRIWGDIPARLSAQSEIVFYDLGETADPGSPQVLDEIRDLVPADRSGFDVVAGAEDAARPAVGTALAGLANGLVLFQPALDGVPEELESVDFSGLEEKTRLYAPLLAAVGEPDAAKWRDLVAEVVDQTSGAHLAPQDRALVQAVIADHAGGIQHELQQAVAARAEGRSSRTRAEPGEPWIDRLRELTVPVVIMSTKAGFPVAEVLAARARRGEAVLSRGEAGLPWLEDRDKAAAVLVGMIERCG
jgi:hypothetical protein